MAVRSGSRAVLVAPSSRATAEAPASSQAPIGSLEGATAPKATPPSAAAARWLSGPGSSNRCTFSVLGPLEPGLEVARGQRPRCEGSPYGQARVAGLGDSAARGSLVHVPFDEDEVRLRICDDAGLVAIVASVAASRGRSRPLPDSGASSRAGSEAATRVAGVRGGHHHRAPPPAPPRRRSRPDLDGLASDAHRSCRPGRRPGASHPGAAGPADGSARSGATTTSAPAATWPAMRSRAACSSRR